jgi:phosphatidyl-myo-inositol alpha-mannosyltransferase
MVSYYLPSSSKIGVGHQVHALANALVDRGHEVTVFSGCDHSDGARYETVTMPLSGANRTFKFAWKLRRVDWSRFDILHAHGDDYWLRRGKPIRVRTLHGSCFSEARWVGSAHGWLRMTLLGLGELVSTITADQVIAVSRNTYRWLPWVRSVIPNGVDMKRFVARKRSARPSVLFVGTYHWRKRGKLLMEIFEAEVRPRIPDAELWMVCPDAPPRPGIRVLGRVSDDELARLYGTAWAFCLPSSYEGFGIPYIEAMAAGTPVVATPNPGALEVTDGGRLGIVVGEAELGRALVDVLTSERLRNELSGRARAAVARYDIDDVTSAYEAVYAGLVGSHE